MDRLFDDKRIAVSLLMVWLAIVLILFKDIGLLETKFMTMGPSTTTVFMGMTLDTWHKWGLVAVFTLINTSINDFMSDALSPWIRVTIYLSNSTRRTAGKDRKPPDPLNFMLPSLSKRRATIDI